MKTFQIFILIFFGTLLNNFSQNFDSNQYEKISLSVVLPENIDGVKNNQLAKIENKIIQITSEYSISAVGFNQNFIIYPKFMIYDEEVVEGGIQKIVLVDCELSLFIKQVDNNTVYSSTSVPLKGSGKSKDEAIADAIKKISSKDIRFKDFIEKGKQRIISYYENKCNDFIIKSESLVKMQQYEEAIALLYSIPDEVSCYKNVQDKTIEAYEAYKNYHCTKEIQMAKTQIAANNYNGALNSLSKIDPSSNCNKEAQTIISNAAKDIDAEEKKLWDFQMKRYNDSVAMEKYRINAIRDIAVAYYNSKPKTVNYNYIFD